MNRQTTTFGPAVAATLALVGCGGSSEEPAPAEPTYRVGEVLTNGDWQFELPLGLQAVAAYVPPSNPLTDARVQLGKLLYFDPRLSADGTISCATCHDPLHGYSDNRPTSEGIGGQIGGRNAPTVINRLFSKEQFWDGRAADLEEQAVGPMANPIEMGHTLDGVVEAIRAVDTYVELFDAAFGKAPNIDDAARAIAAYERTVVSGDSPFDRWQAGDESAVSESVKRGFELFNHKANCVTCHASFNFTDESYHNLGVGMDVTEPDPGRMAVTGEPSDFGAYKTPTLRSIAESAPYMHDGSEATLEDVVELYDRGGVQNDNLSAEMKPLGLTPEEKSDLVAFMRSLSGHVTNSTPPTLP